MSNCESCFAVGKIPCSVSTFAVLPFDRLRANGSFHENVKRKLWKSLGALLAPMVLSVLASACHAGALSIENAEIWGDALYLRLNFAPDSDVLEALDASVPLKFVLRQRRAGAIMVEYLAEQTIALSYAPLLDRFELITNASTKPYRLRAELLDAFSNMRIATTGATEVRLSLSIGALPAPLRLPATLDSDWWLDSGWVPVTTGGNTPTSPKTHSTGQ